MTSPPPLACPPVALALTARLTQSPSDDLSCVGWERTTDVTPALGSHAALRRQTGCAAARKRTFPLIMPRSEDNRQCAATACAGEAAFLIRSSRAVQQGRRVGSSEQRLFCRALKRLTHNSFRTSSARRGSASLPA